ncbi:hypothetical protein F5B20DRAFT_541502 [Whalleya microplaca]|nr:hypothetical protein F5B20DRAFT_541502 [Whalleya microplaca]
MSKQVKQESPWRGSIESTTSSQPLNPAMVYEPSQSPLLSPYRGHDDDDDTPKKPARTVSCQLINRAIVLILSFTNFLLEAVGSPRAALSGFLLTWTIFILLWNIITCIPPNRWKAISGPGNTVPEVSFILGKWKLNFLGGNDDHDDGKKKIAAGWLVDFVLGSVLIILTGVLTTQSWHFSFNRAANLGAITIMGYMIGAFELIIAFLHSFKNCTPVHFTVNPPVYHDIDDDQHPIRLPQDVEASTGVKQPVSISA